VKVGFSTILANSITLDSSNFKTPLAQSPWLAQYITMPKNFENNVISSFLGTHTLLPACSIFSTDKPMPTNNSVVHDLPFYAHQ
jgi:hypothetical protein